MVDGTSVLILCGAVVATRIWPESRSVRGAGVTLALLLLLLSVVACGAGDWLLGLVVGSSAMATLAVSAAPSSRLAGVGRIGAFLAAVVALVAWARADGPVREVVGESRDPSQRAEFVRYVDARPWFGAVGVQAIIAAVVTRRGRRSPAND